MITSEPLLDELLEKLSLPRICDKYSIDDDVVEGVMQLIALRGELVTPAIFLQSLDRKEPRRLENPFTICWLTNPKIVV